MAKIRNMNVPDKDPLWAFECPGCGNLHAFDQRWEYNADPELPTFRPSLLIRSGHYTPGKDGSPCWCTYNAEHPDDPAPYKCGVCHSFVTDGRIQFLSDCTHALAGQTVEIPDWED